ncbi:protein KTI12 homolog [Rhincodon typus]|uniref:protein KTI12 homolog n=1 Tax=Rhincodon typus TaxID=259920 RepID=UPI00202F4DF7|nr:protein KTI12 homolog [Rhincodon typus]
MELLLLRGLLQPRIISSLQWIPEHVKRLKLNVPGGVGGPKSIAVRSEERLDSLGLFSLKQRKQRHDLIEKYKIIKGLKVNRKIYFPQQRDSRKEKDLRGSLKAEVERKINKEDVVIMDSLNYIKGYRYELFCLVKHAQTPHCLIHCDTAVDVCSLWNRNREPEEQYSQEIFDALVMRFEAPDSRNRWDSPLFTIQKEDTLPFEEICNAIFHRKAPPPNQSTLNVSEDSERCQCIQNCQ